MSDYNDKIREIKEKCKGSNLDDIISYLEKEYKLKINNDSGLFNKRSTAENYHLSIHVIYYTQQFIKKHPSLDFRQKTKLPSEEQLIKRILDSFTKSINELENLVEEGKINEVQTYITDLVILSFQLELHNISSDFYVDNFILKLEQFARTCQSRHNNSTLALTIYYMLGSVMDGLVNQQNVQMPLIIATWKNVILKGLKLFVVQNNKKEDAKVSEIFQLYFMSQHVSLNNIRAIHPNVITYPQILLWLYDNSHLYPEKVKTFADSLAINEEYADKYMTQMFLLRLSVAQHKCEDENAAQLVRDYYQNSNTLQNSIKSRSLAVAIKHDNLNNFVISPTTIVATNNDEIISSFLRNKALVNYWFSDGKKKYILSNLVSRAISGQSPELLDCFYNYKHLTVRLTQNQQDQIDRAKLGLKIVELTDQKSISIQTNVDNSVKTQSSPLLSSPAESGSAPPLPAPVVPDSLLASLSVGKKGGLDLSSVSLKKTVQNDEKPESSNAKMLRLIREGAKLRKLDPSTKPQVKVAEDEKDMKSILSRAFKDKFKNVRVDNENNSDDEFDDDSNMNNR